jgi:hypothetical protein
MKERIIIRDARFYDHIHRRGNVCASAIYDDARPIISREVGLLWDGSIDQIVIELEPRTKIKFFNKSI